MFDIQTILVFAGGIVTGGVVALKVIAPRTKTKKDDEALEILREIQRLLSGAKG